jgi:hypothetical protein
MVPPEREPWTNAHVSWFDSGSTAGQGYNGTGIICAPWPCICSRYPSKSRDNIKPSFL